MVTLGRAACWGLALAASVACSHVTPPARRPTAPPPGTGTVAGRVIDGVTGDPISFAVVDATLPGGAGGSATTDSGGRFRITGLWPGSYLVTASYASLRRHQVASVRADRELTLDIGLGAGRGGEPAALDTIAASGPHPRESAYRLAQRTGTIVGTVLDDASSEPLEGAAVAVTSSALRDAQLAVTDGEGRFRMIGLPPATYTLSVYYQLVDYGAIEVRRVGIAVAAGDTTTIPIRLDTSAEAIPD
jgi:hypothetical protein